MHEPTDKQINTVRRLTVLGFWILGLCTNFSYVIILSAAYDLLDFGTNTTNSTTNTTNSTTNTTVCRDEKRGRECNDVSTGVILLAGILPTLILKLTLPWCLDFISYHIRVAVCVLSNIASLIIIGSTHELPLILTGVVFVSIEAGLAEISFLSLTTFYGNGAVVSWSSGTGAAGIVGSLYYLILTSFLPPKTVIYTVLIIPCIMAVSFWGLLFIPQIVCLQLPLLQIYKRSKLKSSESQEHLIDKEDSDGNNSAKEIDENSPIKLTCSTSLPPKREITAEREEKPKKRSDFVHFLIRFLFIRKLWIYMIPLFIVYLFEYMINQGLFELLYYNNACINQNVQYRLYQMLYQLGVFLSRSSTSLFRIRFLWAMSFLQICNFILFYCEAVFQFIPFILITCVVVLFEGLLGGATYANAFYRVRNEIAENKVEFSMGVVSVADSCGITVAAFLSIVIHNQICGC